MLKLGGELVEEILKSRGSGAYVPIAPLGALSR
jgi:hypothetical protein